MGTAPYSATDWWKESQKPLEIAMTSGYHLVMTFTVRELENPWPINGGLLRWEDHLFRLGPWRHHGYVSHNQRVILSIMVPSFFKNSLGSLSEKGVKFFPRQKIILDQISPKKWIGSIFPRQTMVWISTSVVTPICRTPPVSRGRPSWFPEAVVALPRSLGAAERRRDVFEKTGGHV